MTARAPLSFAFVLALGLVPGGFVATSCDAQTCTLVGCGDGLTLEFDETVPRDYTVSVTVDGATDTIDCTVAASPGPEESFGGNLPALDTVVTCETGRLRFGFSPTRVSLVITFPDGVTTTVDAKPAYEETFPNGEDCEPVCRQATYEIDIHPPSG